MASSSCILQKLTLPGVVSLITFSLLSAAFSGYGDLSIFITSLVLIISTIIVTYGKRKNQEETMQEEEEKEVVSQSSTNEQQQQQDSPEQQCSPYLEKVSEEEEEEEEEEKVKTESIDTSIYQEKVVQPQEVATADQIQHDLYSESDSIDDQSFSSDQDSDIDWPYSGKLSSQSPECSDDSISDEESLIEIALPSGHYLGAKEDPNKFSLQQKFQDFSTEKTIFQLFTEINDMNEEENLIEIDLSMGSIKCSRFEIEA